MSRPLRPPRVAPGQDVGARWCLVLEKEGPSLGRCQEVAVARSMRKEDLRKKAFVLMTGELCQATQAYTALVVDVCNLHSALCLDQHMLALTQWSKLARASSTSSNSRQLICHCSQSLVQVPEAVCSLYTAPQPDLEASVETTMCIDTCSKGPSAIEGQGLTTG